MRDVLRINETKTKKAALGSFFYCILHMRKKIIPSF